MLPKTPEILESWSAIAKQTAEQMTGRTQEAITSYFAWLQNAMSASPWGDTDLTKKLMTYASETATAPCAFAQKLSQAKNLEEAIKIQTEFVKTQTDLFNERAKELGDICTKMTTVAAKTFGANRQ